MLVSCTTCGKEIYREWQSHGIAHKYRCHDCKAEAARQRTRAHYRAHKALQRKMERKREYVRRGAPIPKDLQQVTVTAA